VIATEPRRLRRALTTAAALALLVTPLAACTTHTTEADYQPAQGVNSRDGDVEVLNALIVSSEDGEGRFVAAMANNAEEPDEVTGMSGAGEETVEVVLEGGDTAIPAGGSLRLAEQGAATIKVSGEDVTPGGYVRLAIQFANAEPVEVNVPVIEPGEEYADLMTESPSPTEEPTESPTEEASE
jgi:hypothetical protein